jgi:hypothetical protein
MKRVKKKMKPEEISLDNKTREMRTHKMERKMTKE